MVDNFFVVEPDHNEPKRYNELCCRVNNSRDAIWLLSRRVDCMKGDAECGMPLKHDIDMYH